MPRKRQKNAKSRTPKTSRRHLTTTELRIAGSGPRLKTWKTLNQDIVDCKQCARLRGYCQEIGLQKRRAYRDQSYWSRPVPNFGDLPAPILFVGLAQGAHGANRTGRMFTGDQSGVWLYRALHRAGLASRADSVGRDDGLVLRNCAITSVCHCAPPGNRPSVGELKNCRSWLEQSIDCSNPRVLVALGQIAWRGLVFFARSRRWLSERAPAFWHGRLLALADGRWLLGSYHPSQQNTFTGRLTESMLDGIMGQATRLAELTLSPVRRQVIR